jgi:hypothetical protein
LSRSRQSGGRRRAQPAKQGGGGRKSACSGELLAGEGKGATRTTLLGPRGCAEMVEWLRSRAGRRTRRWRQWRRRADTVSGRGSGARDGRLETFYRRVRHAVKQQGRGGKPDACASARDGYRRVARVGAGARAGSDTRRAWAPRVLGPCAASGRVALGRHEASGRAAWGRRAWAWTPRAGGAGAGRLKNISLCSGLSA